MITIIVGGEVYAPRPLGRKDVLLLDGKIAKIGDVDRHAAERLGVEVTIVDAVGCLVTPGFLDPHEHLLGGSGETGFSSQTPEIGLAEIVTSGITTVVGCIGVDTTMKTMAGLLARVKALKEHGLNAYAWSGGYTVPPTSIMASVRDDILFVDEVIGAGEVAIADERSMEPDARDLARVATDAYVGGRLSRKAGLTHVHVGPGTTRLSLVRKVIAEFSVKPEWFYLTHVGRSDELLDEAIDLARQGVNLDLDTVEEDLPRWLGAYRDRGGPLERLTISSDAGMTSPANLFRQLRACVLDHGIPLEEVLPLATSNSARVLALGPKGEIAPGKAGDVVVLERGSLEVLGVLSSGRELVRDGRLVGAPELPEGSNREVEYARSD